MNRSRSSGLAVLSWYCRPRARRLVCSGQPPSCRSRSTWHRTARWGVLVLVLLTAFCAVVAHSRSFALAGRGVQARDGQGPRQRPAQGGDGGWGGGGMYRTAGRRRLWIPDEAECDLLDQLELRVETECHRGGVRGTWIDRRSGRENGRSGGGPPRSSQRVHVYTDMCRPSARLSTPPPPPLPRLRVVAKSHTIGGGAGSPGRRVAGFCVPTAAQGRLPAPATCYLPAACGLRPAVCILRPRQSRLERGRSRLPAAGNRPLCNVGRRQQQSRCHGATT